MESTKLVETAPPKTKRTSVKRFGFNRKLSDEKLKKSTDGNENIVKPQPKQTKKVQAVKPTKSVRKEKHLEEPFPEVSDKSMDIFEVAKTAPKKTKKVAATPTSKRKLLSKARFGFSDATNKPPKPIRGQTPSTSSEESIEDNFVIVDNPDKKGVMTTVLKNFFFAFYFVTSWFV